MDVGGIPILLIAFRRPDLTSQVLSAIRLVRPQNLFVAIDGPRQEVDGEHRLVEQVRQVVVDDVDWDCEVHWRTRDENLGCRRGVTDAIDWFFDSVSEGIILEDDCIPAPEFFAFCEALLDRYRDDERVYAIGGDNSSSIAFSGPWSYGFVRHPAVWGWATWRRAWKHYDRDMQLWKAVRGSEIVDSIFNSDSERRYLTRAFDRMVDHGIPDTWDYQWSATCYLRGGLTIMPKMNLVSNRGFRKDATHTNAPSPLANAPWGSVFPLIHPPIVLPDVSAETQIFQSTAPKKAWRQSLRAKLEKLLGVARQT